MNEFIIQTKDLNFSYSKAQKDIKNLNLNVPKGSIYGFLGPNGSGKTTTIRLLLNLLKEDSGRVMIFNEIIKTNRVSCLHRIGTLIETPSLYEHLNAIDNLKIAKNYRNQVGKNRIDEVLEIVNLSHVKTKKVKKYSYGMKQRLGLAIAILSDPEILILDEPTNGLDPKGIMEMRELIKRLNVDYGTTIFISSHLLSEIEKTCTHVGIIRNGEMMFQNTVMSLINSQKENILIEIESTNSKLLFKVIEPLCSKAEVLNNTIIIATVKNKQEIPNLIDTARKAKNDIFQVKIQNSLEDLFLSLTEN